MLADRATGNSPSSSEAALVNRFSTACVLHDVLTLRLTVFSRLASETWRHGVQLPLCFGGMYANESVRYRHGC
jgi:hypothetical protein